MEECVDPGLIGMHKFCNGANRYVAVDQHCNAVTGTEESHQIVSDEDHRNAEALVQSLDERVDTACGKRIEVGGWLIEKEYAGIER